MSISTFQDKMFKSGCGVTVLLVSAVTMAVGLLAGTQCDNPQAALDQAQQGPAAVKVGEVSIPVDAVQESARMMTGGSSDPKMRAFAMAAALDRAIHEAATQVVARRSGADLSAEGLRTAMTKQIDAYIKSARTQLETSGKLKPGATEQEFVEAFKKENGQTPEEFRKTMLDQIGAQLAQPAGVEQAIAQYGQLVLMEHLRSKRSPSKDEVRASYDDFTFKRILISPPGKSPDEAKQLAEKVLQEVKSGLSFEQAMDRYSNQLPEANKKVSESKIQLRFANLMASAELAPLQNLKVGEVSGILDLPEGKAIYKLISKTNDAPKDFEQNFEKYKEEYLQQVTMQEVGRQIEALTKSNEVQFPLAGFKAVYDYANATQKDPSLRLNPTAYQQRLREIVEAAKAAAKDNVPADDEAAMLARYAAFEELYQAATDKEALMAERIELLREMVQIMPDFQINMDLVRIGVERKDAELATQHLLEAARLNNSFDVTGETRFRDIQARLAQLQKEKLISEDAAKEIEQIQAQWRKDKVENERMEREVKAQQEADLKRQQEEQKKLEEENRKAMEQQKTGGQNATPTTTTGGAAPATTGLTGITTGSGR